MVSLPEGPPQPETRISRRSRSRAVLSVMGRMEAVVSCHASIDASLSTEFLRSETTVALVLLVVLFFLGKNSSPLNPTRAIAPLDEKIQVLTIVTDMWGSHLRLYLLMGKRMQRSRLELHGRKME
ncbi:hypothetical protein FCM35_KLT21765 [Carex littledalei]|uniref:Uncharacterized protein n=1 Tax=Carex littledalei TaxID=544730 RepID=A0A833QFR2_9POAL|nr:hypothetical protein FCM35_KLT21765 [Carex littledalei]